jgi:hypothetical protein
MISVKQAVPMTAQEREKYKPGTGVDPDLQPSAADRAAATTL